MSVQFAGAPSYEDGRELLHLAGLNWPVPDYSAVNRLQKTLKVRIDHDRFLHADGQRGHQDAGRRIMKIKKHRVNVAPLEIRAMKLTDNSVGEAPVLPDLLNQIPIELARPLRSLTGC